MATLLELVNTLLRRTGQREISTLVGAETPATQARDFLNDTYFEILQALKLNLLQKQGTFNTTAGVSAYTLASDADPNTVLADSVMETATADRLREVDYAYPLSRDPAATGRPSVFFRREGKLVLYPTPDAIYTLQYQYLVKPQKLATDAATAALPADWERVLLLGAQAHLEKFLGEPGHADAYLLYREALGQLRAQAPTRPGFRMKGAYRGYQP